jgi:hypothetical protein
VRSSTLDEIPLYMLAGSAIGFNHRSPNVWSAPWGVNNVTEANRAGWMYAPGQGSAQAEGYYGTSGAVPMQALLVASTDGNKVHLQLSGAPAESQVLVLMPSPPSSVIIDRQCGCRKPHLAALRRQCRRMDHMAPARSAECCSNSHRQRVCRKSMLRWRAGGRNGGGGWPAIR